MQQHIFAILPMLYYWITSFRTTFLPPNKIYLTIFLYFICNYSNVPQNAQMKTFSARSARSIVLYPILKLVTQPIIAMVHLPVTILPPPKKKIVAAPLIGIVWLRA